MFGCLPGDWKQYPELPAAATSSFAVLADTIAAEQAAGQVIGWDRMRLAQAIWATVHGISPLGMDGQLSHKNVRKKELNSLARFAVPTLYNGIGAVPGSGT